MATTHVFIVNSKTFKYHLEYMFAGTGAGEGKVDFNNSSTTTLKRQAEDNLVAMIADISRPRIGDYVIFYLEQNRKEGIIDGKFYGIFKIIELNNLVQFYDPNDRNQFLKNELEKSLTFRVKIAPYQVYPEGVTEWEALDDIQSIVSPHQMLWSLIYRKLRGKRGCTPITLYESERLMDLIGQKNNRRVLNLDCYPNRCRLTFEKNKERISIENVASPTYTGRSQELNILPRLIQKHNEGKSYEYHLQVYTVSILGKGINETFDELLLGDTGDLVWLGNEVFCGVGMQKMDMIYTIRQDDRYFHYPVELKSTYPSADSLRQLQRYIDWLRQYYTSNIPGDILPVLIAYKIPNSRSGRRRKYKYNVDGSMSTFYSSIISLINDFNRRNALRIKFVEYDISGRNISFNEVNY